jgi:hypothetical protein
MGGAFASLRSLTTAHANVWRWWRTRLSRASGWRESLNRIIAVRGRPKMIVSDNGTELTSTAILAWSDREQVG